MFLSSVLDIYQKYFVQYVCIRELPRIRDHKHDNTVVFLSMLRYAAKCQWQIQFHPRPR